MWRLTDYSLSLSQVICCFLYSIKVWKSTNLCLFVCLKKESHQNVSYWFHAYKILSGEYKQSKMCLKRDWSTSGPMVEYISRWLAASDLPFSAYLGLFTRDSFIYTFRPIVRIYSSQKNNKSAYFSCKTIK